jgi:tetratricopeptide (TPR) repeat protein
LPIDFPDSPYYHLIAAYAHGELALLLAEDLVRRREAEDARRRALDLLERGAATFRTWPNFSEQIAHTHRLWGFLLERQGRLPEAEMYLREAAKVLQKAAADFPGTAPSQQRLLGNTYESLASLLAHAGRQRDATEALRNALEFPPTQEDHLSCNDLAWTLATWPYAQLSDVPRAITLARRAVELIPDSGNYWNTLGAAYCKAEDWTAAVVALEKADQLLGPCVETSSNACFLAIAHWNLGHGDEARKWLARGNVSLQKHAPNDPYYLQLRAEAQKLIGVGSSSPTDGGKK